MSAGKIGEQNFGKRGDRDRSVAWHNGCGGYKSEKSAGRSIDKCIEIACYERY